MPAKGDGISKRKDGRYVGRYTVHTPDGPKRKVIYGRKYKEVEKKLAEARGDAARGLVFDAKGQTLGQWLERWLEDVVKPGKGHRTYATHRQQVLTHIAPAIGRVKLEALRKIHIDRLYVDLLRAKPEGAGLAPSSVRRVHAVLHAALEEAVRGDLISRNPATHANKPKVRQQEIEPLDTRQALAFMDAARGDRFEALYTLCLMAGLRQGEALGLKWSDVDLDAGTLQVNRQLQRVRRDGEKSGRLVFTEPKNASRRAVGLPQRAVETLRSHRKRQLEEKLRTPDYEDEGLVFASRKGTPLDAQNIVNRYFKPLLERAGLPRSASTTYGTPALACSPSMASPFATCKPSRGTPPPRSPFSATLTITTPQHGVPPMLWVTYCQRTHKQLPSLDAGTAHESTSTRPSLLTTCGRHYTGTNTLRQRR